VYVYPGDKGRHVTTAALGVGEVFFLDPIFIVLVLFIFALAKGVFTWAYWDGFLFTVRLLFLSLTCDVCTDPLFDLQASPV